MTESHTFPLLLFIVSDNLVSTLANDLVARSSVLICLRETLHSRQIKWLRVPRS